jgi:hypothetical protein
MCLHDTIRWMRVTWWHSGCMKPVLLSKSPEWFINSPCVFGHVEGDNRCWESHLSYVERVNFIMLWP